MIRLDHQRVLLIGDPRRQVEAALLSAMPDARVVSVGSYFDAIAELNSGQYTAVLAAVEPIERRPEAAIGTLRRLAGAARLILLAEPAFEPLSRKMLQQGCDDYIITPATPNQLQEVFATPPLRILPPQPPQNHGAQDIEAAPDEAPSIEILGSMAFADVLLDAMMDQPNDAMQVFIRQINSQIAPDAQLLCLPAGAAAPEPQDGLMLLSHPVRGEQQDVAQLHLLLRGRVESPSARHVLDRMALVVGKLHALQERHNKLQKLAITDELTGLYNGRYYRHFLSRITERAKAMRFPVTLLLFDIDNFKQYNDKYGHGVGDEILRETGALMRRCCREHDLVARIGGDEFAVVFWEKEGPRQPKQPTPVPPARTPQTPLQILDRFRRLLMTQEYRGLGTTGKGTLTISGGLAVYPFDAQSVDDLIEAADHALVFGSKKSGKNTIFLVGSGEQKLSPDEPE